MTFQETYNLRADPSMQQRTQVACISTAQDISYEDAGTVDHTKRLAWSKYAFQWPQTVAEQTIWYVVIDPIVQSKGPACEDADIKNVVIAQLPTLMLLVPGAV
jgi:hypothetical protein